MKKTTALTSIYHWLVPAILFATVSAGYSQHKPASHKDILAESRQLVLVTTKDWNAVPGTLQRFERKKSEEKWRKVGKPIQIVVGRNGLAWGRGLYAETNSGPQKVEGDGKSPAGIFRLSSAFGFAPANETELKLPYLHVTEMLECVDDVKSARYNSIVDKSHIINPDWSSSEKMLEIGEAYRLGVVVDHTISPRVAGKGSCIFIHIWKGDGSGTSGCTAMERDEMEKFISWLDAKANPVLAQFPEEEYQRLQRNLKLPARKKSSDK